MIAPTKADIGRKVVYHPNPKDKPEEGVITDVTVAFVLVRYGSDAHSKATLAVMLDWANGFHEKRSTAPSLVSGEAE